MAAYTKRWAWQFGLVSALAIGGVAACSGNRALAQITPDTSLGAESSVVTPNVNLNGLPADQIDGGAIRGANLFHSFREFNVGDGQRVYFANPAGIENILSHVTGTDSSDILGTLGVDGGANLFLLNPNGIIFGPNASLDVAGSFVASTANAIQFGEQGLFSASTPEAPSLLTVNPSAFLFNQIAAQPIANQSVGGLQVPESQSLLLLGGDVSLDGGVLLAPGGRVELGGVAGSGTVGLNVDGNNLGLSFPDSVARADVLLTNGSEVNVRAGGGGSIAINSRNLDVLGGSRLRAGIASGLGSVDSKAGDIEINATGAIVLANGSLISNVVIPGAVGNGDDINITAESLSLTDGAFLSASTFGQGDAGRVLVQANDSVSLNASTIFNTVESEAKGNSGGINIMARSLSFTNGGELQVSTAGQGNAGNVIIQALDSVSFDGVDSDEFSSGIFSTVRPTGVGKAGEIQVVTGSLSLTNGAELLSNTRGRGNAGNVTIQARDTVSFDGVGSNGENSGVYTTVGTGGVGKGGDIQITTGSLFLTNGGEVVATSFGQEGDAGSVTVQANGTVSFDGVGSNGNSSGIFSAVAPEVVGDGGNINIQARSLSVTSGALLSAVTFGQGDAGSVNINTRDTISFDGMSSNGFKSGAASTVQPEAVGNGGDIDITTGSLSVTNGAELTASSQGSNNKAGNIEVEASSIRLDKGALLSADTQGGEGNIVLDSQKLVLRRGSNITTNAEGSEITGGNITLNTDVLAALENSDISANSDNFFGGRVTINAQGIFGTEFRLNPTSESDITATGGSPEFSGTVQINSPDVDPSEGLANLPTEPVDAEIAQDCQAGDGKATSRFINTGSGGLPTNPYEPLDSGEILADVQPPTQWGSNRAGAASTSTSSKTIPDQIVEAQGWNTNKTGEVVLIAKVPPGPSQRGCHLR